MLATISLLDLNVFTNTTKKGNTKAANSTPATPYKAIVAHFRFHLTDVRLDEGRTGLCKLFHTYTRHASTSRFLLKCTWRRDRMRTTIRYTTPFACAKLKSRYTYAVW